jgi:REP element-mobilizing transposase RayT
MDRAPFRGARSGGPTERNGGAKGAPFIVVGRKPPVMARPLRYIPPGSLVEVTTRTVHGRLLLRPGPEVNDIVLGVLGRAQSLFSIRVHAVVVLSNHWHALLTVDDAAQLAGFVGFVNGNVAREIGRLHDWRHRFWARRYRSIVIADDTAAVARLRYILQNGCQEGLVDRPADWPGLSCVRALVKGKPLIGTWHDRTAEYNAGRARRSALPGRFAARYRLHLSPLPCWQNLSAARQRQMASELISSIEDDTRAERTRSGRECVGRERIVAMNPHERPIESETSSAPAVHASCPQTRTAFKRAYAAFVDAFRAAAACLRRGEKCEFPLGAFPPRGPFIRPISAPS